MNLNFQEKLMPLLKERLSSNLAWGEWGYSNCLENIVVVYKYKPGRLSYNNKTTECLFEIKTITVLGIENAPSDECFLVLERDKCEINPDYYGECFMSIKDLLDFICFKFAKADAKTI